jgi:hypothetical protein
MRKNSRQRHCDARVALAITLASFVAVFGLGCGGDDHGPSARFVGDVRAVIPTQTSLRTSARPALAAVDWMLPSDAIAQSTCPALHVLACVSNGRDEARCRSVDADSCELDVSIDVLDNFFSDGTVFFVDDANGNGREDAGESTAMLTNPLGAVCNGSVVTLTGVAIDFVGGSATAISAIKDPDTCASITPGPGTPGFRTPTPSPYSYGASLNQPPTTMLAFLFGAGAVGLILPRRRARR